MPAIPTVIKQPAESRLYTMDFAALLGSGETISAVSSRSISPTTLSPLEFSGVSVFSGTVAQVRLTGGLDGTKYKVTIVVTTSASNTLEGEGIVQMEDL